MSLRKITSAFGAVAVLLVVNFLPARARAITEVNSSSAQNNIATTLTIATPSGAVAGDVMVASVTVENQPTITAPSGWTLIRKDTNPASLHLEQADYYHVAGTAEPANYTWTFSAAHGASGGIIDYSGVDNVNPVDASGGQTGNSSTIITAPSVTTTAVGDQLIAIYGDGVNRTYTSPSGMTLRYSNSTTTSGEKTDILAFDQQLTSAGATGSRSITPSGTSVYVGQLIALRSAPAVNNPPVVDSVVINQTSPQTDDTLTATVQAHDPDGNPITLRYQWLLNGFNIPGATSPTLDLSQPGNGNKGDMIQLSVTASDGQLNSQPVTSAGVTIADSPPSATVSLDNAAPSTSSSITATAVDNDADGDSVMNTFVWKINGQVQQTLNTTGNQATLDLSTISGLKAGDVVSVELTPGDGTLNGITVSASATVTQPLSPPVISSVNITPTSPQTNDTLSVQVVAADSQNNPLTYTYQWTLNGTNIPGATNATLDLSQAGNGNKGDSVSVTVVASDGQYTSQPVTSSAVTIVNSPPSASVSLDNTAPDMSSTITATAVSTDPDGDQILNSFVWKVNGQVLFSSQTIGNQSSMRLSAYSSELQNGDDITVELTPYDGTAYGPTTSASAIITATPPVNQPPVINSVSINNQAPKTTDVVAAVVSASDPDGDTLTYSYQWYLNGSAISGATNSSLDLSTLGKGLNGSSLTVQVTAFDGQAYSQPVTSSPVIIANTLPVVSSVTLSPASPTTADKLTATATASDADGNPITFYQFNWSVNGALVSTTGSSANISTISVGLYAKAGDTVSVQAQATDNSSPSGPYGQSASASTVVAASSSFGNITEYPIGGSAVPSNLFSDGNNSVWFTMEPGQNSPNSVGRIYMGGAITKYPLPSLGNEGGITKGSDGNIWFSESNVNKVGMVTPSGVVTEYSTGSLTPAGIITGSDGNLWVMCTTSNLIIKMSTAGSILSTYTVPTAGAFPHGPSLGPDGNVWFAESKVGKIGKITPSGVISEYKLPVSTSQPMVTAAGADGNVWFTEYSNNKIGRVTPSGVITEFALPQANSNPMGIFGGPDGNVWFTEQTTNMIGMITPAGGIRQFSIPTANAKPDKIVPGPDGNMWFCEHNVAQIGVISLH